MTGYELIKTIVEAGGVEAGGLVGSLGFVFLILKLILNYRQQGGNGYKGKIAELERTVTNDFAHRFERLEEKVDQLSERVAVVETKLKIKQYGDHSTQD